VYIALACLGVVTIRMIAGAMGRSRQSVRARPAGDQP
jgi:hypothetical protein